MYAEYRLQRQLTALKSNDESKNVGWDGHPAPVYKESRKQGRAPEWLLPVRAERALNFDVEAGEN